LPDTELLRSELFSIEQLKRHAASLAQTHRIDPQPGLDRLLPRLADNEAIIRSAYDVVTAAVLPGQRIVPAEAWLLDNYYVIEQQIGLVRHHLPRDYSRQLPRLADGLSAGLPRIYDLAIELISHMDGRVDNVNARQIILAYQSVEPLKLGELWAFPIMLQLALLENLRRVGLLIARRREELDAAVVWADRMLATADHEPQQLIQLLAEFANADVPLTAPFVEEFYARLQAHGPEMAFVQTWVEHKLVEQGVSAVQLSAAAARMAAANQISIANSIASLRFINATDWRDYVEALSLVEQTLREDPAAMYAAQDFATRDRYRHVIEELARDSDHDELDVARQAIAMAQSAGEEAERVQRTRHVGYYLIDRGRPALEDLLGFDASGWLRVKRAGRRFRLLWLLAPILLLSAALTSVGLFAFGGFEWTDWRGWFFAVSGFIAASALVVPLVNLIVTLLMPPRVLPRLDFSTGIPSAHRSMVVIPTLLSNTGELDSLIDDLEIRYLGNRDSNLFFALLTDFRDADAPTLHSDAALLACARQAVQRLNASYSDDRECIFYLFHRPRTWNPVERVWMGYERKRGKLEQFNALLRGGAQDAFCMIVGDTGVLTSIQYVLTLDTDTQLPRDVARTLVGNMAHPLNRPVYDPVSGRVVDGYAILQPRASISMESAGRSRFARLFSGESGIDPYSREVSDVYQDVFGEGSFIGKGIYDVDAFRQALAGRLPENLILSHDLLEGGYARSALVTDVDLIEEHPQSYAVDVSRRHRWIRGDWQLARWLLPHVPGPANARQPNPLSLLSRWKIADNLRRSLVSAALLSLLLGGWLLTTVPLWMGSLMIATVVLLPGLFASLLELLRKPAKRDWRVHLVLTAHAARRPLAHALLSLTMLPYDALMCLDAIQRSALRLPFTRRGLLVWHLPRYSRRNACRSVADYSLEMWFAPLLAMILIVWLGQTRAGEWLAWMPLLSLWLLSPLLAWWISRPMENRSANLNPAQRNFLRISARRTWRFFDDFVGAEDHWLPPDNFQEYPVPLLASRTSPTNMGMSLLADLAAHDFGYICGRTLLQRLSNTLASMQKLERHHGHFYNWYDTRSLLPLAPRYVSSVDSGNLVGCLLTLQAGLQELKQQPVLGAFAFQGLQDTLQVFVELLASSSATQSSTNLVARVASLQQRLNATPQSPAEAEDVLAEIVQTKYRLASALTRNSHNNKDHEGECHYWAQAFDHQAQALLNDFRLLVGDPGDYEHMPTLSEVAASGRHPAAAQAASERIAGIDDLVACCRGLSMIDFGFLYDSSRGLLSIGYDVTERRRDPACYDLLASEARLASFILIAQGQLPQKHWFSLGRLLTSHAGEVSLISWSGSMFEYLMPQLMMPCFDNTLLDHSLKAAVARQIEYGRQREVPWGISESAYNATDMHRVYQYRAFGVPGLGFKRGLGDDLVIAPYASALALTVRPLEACRNLQGMAASGFCGRYGFYEAIDYTPSRLPRGSDHAIVRSFMVHHQGMSLLAFEHALLERPMQRRFLSDPQIRATELLLQERVPKKGATLHPHAAEVSAAANPALAEVSEIMHVFRDPDSAAPEVQLLSNGRYHVMATHAGGGYSRFGGLAISRWREDATSDDWGTFIYLRDRDSLEYWSAAYQPTRRKAEHYEAIFVQARAEYRRRDQAIETHTEICVSPEDDVEIRRVTLNNRSSHTREIEISSYTEVVLAPMNSDLAHRCFSNLFVQTEILPAQQAILCTRRPRTPGERTPWLFHLMAAPGAVTRQPSYETDRALFIGRGRSVANPFALDRDNLQPLSNSQGPVLDPIMAIRRSVTLQADESAMLQIVSGVATTREAALALIEKYSDRHCAERAFEMSWFQSQEVLHHLNASESDAWVFGRLAGSVIYSNAPRRALPSTIARNQLGQSGLWRFGVSGDLPIVLMSIGDVTRIDLVKQVLKAHAYWRMKGLVCDLVIINEDFSGYRAVLQDLIVGLLNSGPDAQTIDKPGGVFVRRAEELSEEDRVLLQSVARVTLSDAGDDLVEQVQRRERKQRLPERLVATRVAAAAKTPQLAPRERIFCNGLGGFTPDGREYVITLEAGQNTPAPWVNVIASPHIGTVVSESGGAYTWVENAHEFRLTPWHNDPVSDSSGEALYIRDEESALFWSPTPLPARGQSGYVCRHGFGYSVFEHDEAGIFSQLHHYVAMDAAVKFAVVRLRNHSGRARRLSLTGYWELVMGEWRHRNMMHIVTETDPANGALLARNAYGRECANRVVFAQVSETSHTVSGSRREFIGRNGSLADPAAMQRVSLSGRSGAGLDPCAALQTHIELADGQEREVVFVFGAAHSDDEARHFIERFGGVTGARQALEKVWEYWNHTLGAVNVDTPDPALNVMANGWLLYQTLSCRLWGRSGFYQSGGAYGFRDQLQDSMALMHAAPWLAREQIIRCAGRQFAQGDVQHWWHPPEGQGVRTRFSDDYLWLVYATCRYVQATGDTAVLDESIHYLEGRALSADEEAYYDQPQRSAEAASLYQHCVRAIEHGLRFGAHQLPLIGCGDWNDGMNLIGKDGKGESVWLAWFLYDNLRHFADLARGRDDQDFADRCSAQAETLRDNTEANAWDGEWYRRAYFDDGTPLGSSDNDECQIDSISQSWAVLCAGGDPQRARQAMQQVDQRLVRRETQLIQLLDPPFDQSDLEPGYIKGYVPGVRENGGQYTHAAIWASMAFAMLGDRQRAWELFAMLNPVNHAATPDAMQRYKVEPYVMCADIYAAAPHSGRGGWTWYTGAAGWMYRLTLETLLGVHLEGDTLHITPCIPDHWPSYCVHYRFRETVYHLTIRRIREGSQRVTRILEDGKSCGNPVNGGHATIALVDDRRDHYIDVELG
jgi:cyclic beta-1,2-glucan synthetase